VHALQLLARGAPRSAAWSRHARRRSRWSVVPRRELSVSLARGRTRGRPRRHRAMHCSIIPLCTNLMSRTVSSHPAGAADRSALFYLL